MHSDNLVDVGGVLRGVNRCVNRFAVNRPVLQRDAQHRQRQYGGHDVGEVVDEVDAAIFDLLVEAGAGYLVDERHPTLHRRRGQIGVEHVAVDAVLGLIHLQNAAPHAARAFGLGDRNALIASAFAVDVVVGGDNRATRQLEYRVASAGNPVAVVGVGPRDRALVVD